MTSKILVFDVETPNCRNDRICSIGISIIDNGRILETKNLLVNPECEFSDRNVMIHGIHPADVIDAPTFDVVWNDISELFRNSLLVAHNATFDLSVLKKTLNAYSIEESIVYFICTMRLTQNFIKNVENHRLDTLCDFFDISLDHHNAGSDSHACAEILCRLINDGIDIDNYIRSYSLSSTECVSMTKKRHESIQTHDLHELSKLISDISQDGVLTTEEIECLDKWLFTHSELSGNFPYDKIFSMLNEVLADGVVEQSEIEVLMQLFEQVADPINDVFGSKELFDINGKNICLSGEFQHGEKTRIEEQLICKGATVLTSMSKKVDILLVGSKGSHAWSAGKYGTKIKKAIELKEKGIEILIIKEEDFFNAMEEKNGTSFI